MEHLSTTSGASALVAQAALETMGVNGRVVGIS
jgi:hypothetical protein